MPRKYLKRKRSYRKSRRGKYARKRNLKRLITKVMMKKVETKYYDVAEENQQLYHNIGYSPVAPVSNFEGGMSVFFDLWSDISVGTTRQNRIGEKVYPRGMALKIWLSNKLDRPNVSYRVIIASMPRSRGNVVTTPNNVDLFQAPGLGNNGNKLLLPLDKDKGIKAYYDRIIRINNASNTNKEIHKTLKLWIKRKRASPIVWDSNTGQILNKPVSLYIIPYDSYGTIGTDNIASCAYWARIYFKDP